MPNQPASISNEPKVAPGMRLVPVLPVRDTVLFPHAVLPLTVGRESSIQLIESLGDERSIVVAAQLDARLDMPKPSDLHGVGTLATVHKVVRMPNQSRFVFTEGVTRVRLVRFVQSEPFMMAEVETLEDLSPASSAEFEALVRNVISQFQQIVAESPTLSDELRTIAANIDEPARLVDFVASSLPFLTTDDKQQLLETANVPERLEQLNKLLAREIEVQQLRAKIQTEVQDQVQQSQRDYYLREQLKAIQKELGEQDEGQRDVEDLRQKIEDAGMPEDVKKEAMKELGRLQRMSPMAADYGLTRNYIEWLAVLPWSKSSGSKVDIGKAREILDEDHYELKKVKDRILDYLSVLAPARCPPWRSWTAGWRTGRSSWSTRWPTTPPQACWSWRQPAQGHRLRSGARRRGGDPARRAGRHRRGRGRARQAGPVRRLAGEQAGVLRRVPARRRHRSRLRGAMGVRAVQAGRRRQADRGQAQD